LGKIRYGSFSLIEYKFEFIQHVRKWFRADFRYMAHSTHMDNANFTQSGVASIVLVIGVH
jgi:hypothetical protein